MREPGVPGGGPGSVLYDELHRPALVQALVLLNPMVPLPGETGGGWWEVTGQPPAQLEGELFDRLFLVEFQCRVLGERLGP